MDDIRPNVSPNSSRFIDQLRIHIRQSGLAYKTEQTYIQWIKRYIYFHNKQHPKDMSNSEIEAFLNHLSLNRHCSTNTQRTALNALVYLYKRFLGVEVNLLHYQPAKAPRRLPVVYSREEIVKILQQLRGASRLQVELMYGTGLRMAELLSLRVKDIDFSSNNVFVRGGKGNKDRTTILPDRLKSLLQDQIKNVKQLHDQDIEAGYGSVYMPDALNRKYPTAARELTWQYLFPSQKISKDPRSDVYRRHHAHPSSLNKSIRRAVRESGINKPARAHSFRHSFGYTFIGSWL